MWKRNLLALVAALLASALLTTREQPSGLANIPRGSAAIVTVDPDDIALDQLSLPLTPHQLTAMRGTPDYINKEWKHFVEWSYSRTTVTFSSMPFEPPQTTITGRILTSHNQTVLCHGATESRTRTVLAPLGEPTEISLVESIGEEGPFRLEYRGANLKTGVNITIEAGKVSKIDLCPPWSELDEVFREVLKASSRSTPGNPKR